jgi:hypothetical protein
LQKRTKPVHFFEPTTPDKLALVNGYIRATIAHVLPSVRFEVYGLDDHEALKVGRAEKGRRLGDDLPHYMKQGLPHFSIHKPEK